jgi:hypothetical protein
MLRQAADRQRGSVGREHGLCADRGFGAPRRFGLHGAMMPRPTKRSDRIVCDGLRSCATFCWRIIDAPHFGDGATTSSAATLTFALTEFEMKQ